MPPPTLADKRQNPLPTLSLPQTTADLQQKKITPQNTRSADDTSLNVTASECATIRSTSTLDPKPRKSHVTEDSGYDAESEERPSSRDPSLYRNSNPSKSSHSHPFLPRSSSQTTLAGLTGNISRKQSFSADSEAGDCVDSRERYGSTISRRNSFEAEREKSILEALQHPFPRLAKHRGRRSRQGSAVFECDPDEPVDPTPDIKWMSTEEKRLEEDSRHAKHWKRWGPYLSERQWATVREDYSCNGDAWSHFPHDHARSRAYRWGEDGLAGLSDNHGRLCFSVGLWNEKDDILKERLFGVTGHEGNHGEDVKELYYYLDSTPTHSYMKFLYKYPQRPYPYERLVRESSNRSRDVEEFEITDTDMFEGNKYWDVFVEYAKATDNPNSLSIRITAYNRSPEPATLHILPQVWFRNTWSWTDQPPVDVDSKSAPSKKPTNGSRQKVNFKPVMKQVNEGVVELNHNELGKYWWIVGSSPGPADPGSTDAVVEDRQDVTPEMLFTENETNFERLYGGNNPAPWRKDAFHEYVVGGYRFKQEEIRLTEEAEMEKRKAMEKEEKLKKEALERAEKLKFSKNAFGGLKLSNGATIEEVSDDMETDGYDTDKTADGTKTPTEYPSSKKQKVESLGRPPLEAVNPGKRGTKGAAHFVFKDVPGNGGVAVVRMRLSDVLSEPDDFQTSSEAPAENASADMLLDEESFDMLIEARRTDADEFYSRFNSGALSDDLRSIMRQGLAGMLWSKQFYMFIQEQWINGDPGQPPPPKERKDIRNADWKHMHIEDILSMPDKWEYPFFAIWDTAFHCIPLAMVDPAFAKKQLDIMTREWYMKPDGALPAYEWNFSDVNPPVHAWATFRVFKIERKMHGKEDLQFLERVFQKLLLNFTWWVNQKDPEGQNVFEGGFLGLDNISPFNRSEKLPTGGTMRQADGTGWMGFYSLSMLSIALELAKHNPVYEDIASKFFEHFLFISDAMTFHSGQEDEVSLWSDEDGFYFDAITWGPNAIKQLPVRSLVGLIPLYATLTLEPATLKKFPGFKKRMDWFIENRSSISKRNIANMSADGKGDRRLLALANEDRLRRILERMLDENEFLSDYGIRSLSRYHLENPWSMEVDGSEFSVEYWPGDSKSGMFGGNSNWRGPIWLATTFLLIESLQRFYQYHGRKLKVECPKGSGQMMNLASVAEEIQHRLIHIFARDEEGKRACNGNSELFNHDPNFRDYVQFHEFFHADNGKGLGASHQTGWTGLISYIIWQTGSSARLPRTPRTPRSAAAFYFDEAPATPGVSDYEYTSDGTSIVERQTDSETGSDSDDGDLSCGELSPEDL